LLISPQTQISCGSPHIGQISAMTLTLSFARELFKIFNIRRAGAHEWKLVPQD
jgi:hypothetical protein